VNPYPSSGCWDLPIKTGCTFSSWAISFCGQTFLIFYMGCRM
jgi:hypothetical protein